MAVLEPSYPTPLFLENKWSAVTLVPNGSAFVLSHFADYAKRTELVLGKVRKEVIQNLGLHH